MPIEAHIMEDEEVLASYRTEYWGWVCTDRRVIKYRSGEDDGTEQLHDVSYDEITGISMVNSGRNSSYAVGAGVFTAVGFIGLLIGGNLSILIFLLGIAAGILLYITWKNSPRSYFGLRGVGLVSQEPEKWQINQPEATDKSTEIQEFVKTVRSQL
jgi:hypothetical protein